MKTIFNGLLALLLCTCVSAQITAQEDFRKMAPEPGPVPEIQIGDFQDFTLDNGLQVVLVENHKLPRVSYQLYVDVPAHLESDYAGASDMMGDMLRRATSTMTKQEIDEAVDFIGANLSTSGRGAYASTITKYKDEVIKMMADVVLDAQFPQEDFDKVKDDALANLKSALSNPDAIADRARRVVTFGPNHPYGELTTEKSLNAITLPIVEEYYNTYFVPNRSYLVMVGDLTRADAEKMANQHFGDWEQKLVAEPEFTMPVSPEGVTVNFVPRSGAVQSNIIITSPVKLEPGTKEAIRADLVNSILGSGFEGRLFKNLREDKAYTYGAYSSANDDKLVGTFTARSNVRSEVTDSAVTEFMYELKKISTEDVSDDELARAKTSVYGSFGRALENPQRIASYALNTLRYDLDRDFYPTYLQRVQKSSANDLREVAEDLITPDNINIIVVGDKAVAEKLARFATNGKINYLDENGLEIDMAAMEAPADLTPQQVITDYIDAIGGLTALQAVRNYSQVMEATIQGQTMQQTMIKDGGKKFSSQTTAMGSVMADQRYNDGQVKMTQMGQTMAANDEMTKGMAAQAALFPVADLANRIDEVTVTGTEMIDGKKVVVLKETESGAQYFFDQTSKLLVRQVQDQGGVTATIDYGDYKTIDGVMFPYSTSISGVMPFPLDMKTTDLKVNTEIDQTLFDVD
ncbi:M16 family metallopeptidase [Neolewinella antarctica]|uniref:Zn-dependent peptidase n=1 Tax=Neolewinella antarctica TaxID=442734 RepID=A0ABX0X941_9BACT|nr:pitrilysin family protein [Neolewinella antarctica]NJC25521.1 putative Zn-dependent peptidase [Neolewinella antarctica]